jgi:hypothetical protein
MRQRHDRPQFGLAKGHAFHYKLAHAKQIQSEARRMPGEFVDLSSEPEPSPNQGREACHGGAGQERSRPFVGVHFACCGVYSRVYINRQRTAYVGFCPRCSNRVELTIGPEGTDSRFFTAY